MFLHICSFCAAKNQNWISMYEKNYKRMFLHNSDNCLSLKTDEFFPFDFLNIFPKTFLIRKTGFGKNRIS